jgi:hypothetical protein
MASEQEKLQLTLNKTEAKGKEDKAPENVVQVMEKHGLKIKLEKLRQDLLLDQGAGMIASDGCISNPGGPGC